MTPLSVLHLIGKIITISTFGQLSAAVGVLKNHGRKSSKSAQHQDS
jgi:hypothetical protein